MARGSADLALQRAGQRPRHEVGVRKRGKLHQARPVLELPSQVPGRLQGEPRLAAAARPGEGEEAGSGEEPPYLLELPRAPDEAQKLQRQVAERPEGLLPRTAAPQGDRRVLAPVGDDLERVLGLRASSCHARYQPTVRTIPAMRSQRIVQTGEFRGL
jgi:hypothetical protein